jgi:hypothetical protein
VGSKRLVDQDDVEDMEEQKYTHLDNLYFEENKGDLE